MDLYQSSLAPKTLLKAFAIIVALSVTKKLSAM